MDFDDVRSEEWTPSHAGGSARMDFLVHPYKIAVEIKMTRKSLGDREVGEELLIDVARYKEHPKCRFLYCFVYDPGRVIRNARGLESDIRSQSSEKLNVELSVRP